MIWRNDVLPFVHTEFLCPKSESAMRRAFAFERVSGSLSIQRARISPLVCDDTLRLSICVRTASLNVMSLAFVSHSWDAALLSTAFSIASCKLGSPGLVTPTE
jgi:hypothetical protein